MLSEAKHLAVHRKRPFASPSLRSGLRLTQGDNTLPMLDVKIHHRAATPLFRFDGSPISVYYPRIAGVS
jgi:hypothetical protein